MGINKEDYEENRCVLCMDNPNGEKIFPVDMQRITSKLDEYLDKQDWAGAESHLNYWLKEAEYGNDIKGQFSIENEIMGLKRKLGKKDEALEAAKKTLKLAEILNNADSIGGATALVNCGTVYEAFGKETEALKMYKKAQPVYEKYLSKDSPKLGSLYNNMAMAMALCADYDNAFIYYAKAIDIMGKLENGEIEQALTYLNMADAYNLKLGLEDGAEKIEYCLDKAELLLDSPGINRNGYYAFMAEKCIECFRYYGYFFYANELEKRVKFIYDSLK